MKKTIKLFLIMAALLPALAMARNHNHQGHHNHHQSNADAEFASSVSASSLIMQTIMFTSGEATSLSDDWGEEELRVVQDDAVAYLAGEEMTDKLAAVIEGIDLRAQENGMEELVGNTDRIVFEILKV